MMSDIQPRQNPMPQSNIPQAYPAAPVVGLGEWVITLVVFMIPLVNIVMLFVWAFGSGTNPSKANFCKAYLLVALVTFVLALVLIFALGLGAAALQQGV